MYVEFSFDKVMYRPIDRASMGSPMGPALANIFVVFHEKEVLSSPNKPEVYFCYVDDNLCLFNSETEADLYIFFYFP